ncbi:MFS transporter [Gilvimarinus sp. DA14]|uniref:MFS transporter n=1 Tax=Gilvimarinus sp. DA14 TaxID=2956798 RepID=UPI0020B68F00|nr:MFS transporter [Gilvimarinus sp. DA14]UTF61124.1 MFS transporter [Gilvimarinus sp. DA14]
MKASSVSENLYDKLVNEEDARICKAIDERACREVPGNFFTLILSYFCSKLGDALANPKIVLPWVMEVLQAPVYLLGFLVPIRESGSLLPQLFIASFVRRQPLRKWLWVGGSVLQALCMLAMAAVVWTLEGAAAGWAIIALLVVFALARGLCSVAAKDVLGKTIPKSRRGQVNGWSASAAGLVTVLLAVALIVSKNELSIWGCTLLLLGAGGMWLLAAVIYSRMVEFAGETSGGGNAITEAVARLGLLRNDKPFRRFVITRSLLLCSALTAPYYVVLAQQQVGQSGVLLGLFLLASGLASLLSAPFWGRFADVSSRRVMMLAAWLTAVLGFMVFALHTWAPHWLGYSAVLPVFYFFLTVAHQGVRVGRKTYVVDLAEGNRRTDYVALSNTIIGVVLLLLGVSGWIASELGISWAILLLSAAGAAGALLARTLPEA